MKHITETCLVLFYDSHKVTYANWKEYRPPILVVRLNRPKDEAWKYIGKVERKTRCKAKSVLVFGNTKRTMNGIKAVFDRLARKYRCNIHWFIEEIDADRLNEAGEGILVVFYDTPLVFGPELDPAVEPPTALLSFDGYLTGVDLANTMVILKKKGIDVGAWIVVPSTPENEAYFENRSTLFRTNVNRCLTCFRTNPVRSCDTCELRRVLDFAVKVAAETDGGPYDFDTEEVRRDKEEDDSGEAE